MELSVQDKKILQVLQKLPKDFWDFPTCKSSAHAHGLHYYPAILVHPVVENLLRIFQQTFKIEKFLDPFAGSGTAIIEGRISGIKNIYATDLNPLAVLISSVKARSFSSEKLNSLKLIFPKVRQAFAKYQNEIETFDKYIRNDLRINVAQGEWTKNANLLLKQFKGPEKIVATIPQFLELGYWFVPKVTLKLAMLKLLIDLEKDQEAKEFLLVAFSETVRKSSNFPGNDFRRKRMSASEIINLNPDVYLIFESVLNRNIRKMGEFQKKIKIDAESVNVILDDARILKNIPDDSIDLVITSPPYGDSNTTVRYGGTSFLSTRWLDLADFQEKTELDKSLLGGLPYSDKNQWILLGSQTLTQKLEEINNLDPERVNDVFSFFIDLDKAIYAITKKCKRDSYQVWIVGNRSVKDVRLPTDIIITELSKKYGLAQLYKTQKKIFHHSSKIDRMDKVSMAEEIILVYKKI